MPGKCQAPVKNIRAIEKAWFLIIEGPKSREWYRHEINTHTHIPVHTQINI